MHFEKLLIFPNQQVAPESYLCSQLLQLQHDHEKSRYLTAKIKANHQDGLSTKKVRLTIHFQITYL